MESGKFPDELKSALVKPLNKKGDKNEVKNYTLSSILNGFSKIYEKADRNRLLSFFDKFSVIFVNQHGFRKKSINKALI